MTEENRNISQEVITMTPKERENWEAEVKELVNLAIIAESAKLTYSEQVKAVAEGWKEYGVEAGDLKAFTTAEAKGNLADAIRKVEKRLELFSMAQKEE